MRTLEHREVKKFAQGHPAIMSEPGFKLWLHRTDSPRPRAEFSASVGWLASGAPSLSASVPKPRGCLVSASSQPPSLGFLFFPAPPYVWQAVSLPIPV